MTRYSPSRDIMYTAPPGGDGDADDGTVADAEADSATPEPADDD